MNTRYAAQTAVSSASSRDEIERTLTRYGASQFMYGWAETGAVIAFVAKGMQIRFTLTMPDRNADEFIFTPSKKLRRSPDEASKAYEQAVRARWRALALVIKAKLEATESGISVFEEEFLAHIVLPDGHTVGEQAIPAVQQMYEVGGMRPLLEITSGGAE